MVLRGRIAVEQGDAVHPLGSGDALHFNPQLPHKRCNDGAKIARILIVVAQ